MRHDAFRHATYRHFSQRTILFYFSLFVSIAAVALFLILINLPFTPTARLPLLLPPSRRRRSSSAPPAEQILMPATSPAAVFAAMPP